MNKFYGISIFFILFLLSGCGNEKNTDFKLEKGTVIVEGKVSNFEKSSNIIHFSGNDIITYEINQYTRIDSLGYFRKEIEIYHSLVLSMIYLNSPASIYVKPGDSLFIEMDANLIKKNELPYYKVTGSNAETSKNISDFLLSDFGKLYQNNFEFNNFNKPVKEFLVSVKKIQDLEVSFLKEFQKKHKTTKDFNTWAYNYIVYKNANSLSVYSGLKERNNIKIEGNLVDKKSFPVNNDSALGISTYITYLSFYFSQTYIVGDSLLLDFAKQNKNKEAAIYIISKVTKNEEPGLSRDYMIYALLQGMFESSPEDFASLLDEKKTNIQSKELLDNLLKRKFEYEKKKNHEEISDRDKNETTAGFWKNLKAKYKNKIIYIDIFATWCGPCRFEIPHAQDLHKDFEGKPVAFVNLCLASEREDWEKFISENDLRGDNYFLNKDQTTIFWSELNYTGYPTYMIMDKKGDLINKTAPRPSQTEEITTLLIKLLNE